MDEKEVFEYASSVNATHFYTSAKQNMGLSETFQNLAKNMVERKKAKLGEGVAGLGKPGKQKLVVIDDESSGSKKRGDGGCC